MERKKINEITELKIKNLNLSLRLLQVQADYIIAERDKILLAEFKRLRCKPGEWQLDEQTWELKEKA